MHIQKVSFGGVYNVHCSSKKQAKELLRTSRNTRFTPVENVNDKKSVYLISDDVARDMRSLPSCVAETTGNWVLSDEYKAVETHVWEIMKRQLLEKAIDIVI